MDNDGGFDSNKNVATSWDRHEKYWNTSACIHEHELINDTYMMIL